MNSCTVFVLYNSLSCGRYCQSCVFKAPKCIRSVPLINWTAAEGWTLPWFIQQAGGTRRHASSPRCPADGWLAGGPSFSPRPFIGRFSGWIYKKWGRVRIQLDQFCQRTETDADEAKIESSKTKKKTNLKRSAYPQQFLSTLILIGQAVESEE